MTAETFMSLPTQDAPFYLDKIKHFPNGYDERKKNFFFFQKRFLIKLRCVIYICGFYGSANMGAAGQIVAKMNKTGHCPSRFFQPHPLPQRRPCPHRHLGTLQVAFRPCFGDHQETVQSTDSQSVVLPQPHQHLPKLSEMQLRRPRPGLRNQKLRGAAQLPGFSQALRRC